MFGKFVGIWVDESGFNATITGDDGVVKVEYTDVNRGPFYGEEGEFGTAGIPFLKVTFTDANEVLQGTLVGDADKKINWSNGTVWSRVSESPEPFGETYRKMRQQIMERIRGIDANVLISVVSQHSALMPPQFFSDWPDTFNRDTWYKTWGKAEGPGVLRIAAEPDVERETGE